MISAILGRLAPYLAAALLASAGLNWFLGHELLGKQEQLGEATQAVRTQAVKDALVGSEAVRTAITAADAGTINQLKGQLAQEQSAYDARQGDLNRLQAALVESTRRLNDALLTQPALAQFLGTPIPAALLDPGILCWYDGAAYSPACGGAPAPLREPAGSGHR